jgi:hypothetical protein
MIEAPRLDWAPPDEWADDLVALGLTSHGTVTFASSVATMRLLVHDRRTVGPLAREGPLPNRTRSRLVRDFLTSPDYADASWLLQLDGDVIVPKHAARALVTIARGLGLDVVAGVYSTASGDAEGQVFDPEAGELLDVAELPPETVAEVDRVGAGCLLCSRSILERVTAEFGWASVFDTITQTDEAGETRLASEDFAFCARVRKLGGRIALASWVRALHCKPLLIQPARELPEDELAELLAALPTRCTT